ncbi:MAG TPA: tetratricopeptide repeat protein [Dongiaceae bacterium]|nr:tetratricopeptide repeat protein [Dongiaceae bacterium]
MTYRLLLHTTILCLLLTTPAFAAEPTSPEKKAPSLSVSFYKKLSEAYESIDKKKSDNARAILQKLAEQTSNSPYENGLVWKTIGYLHYQNGDYKQSEQAFEKALQFDIPTVLAQETRRLLGQVYLSDSQPEKATAHLSRWLTLATPEQLAKAEDVRLSLAQSYYQLKQYNKAVAQLSTVIQQYEQEGRQPKESWLTLLQASLAQVDEVQERIDVLRRLLKWYPKAEYWLALASAYGQMDKMDDYMAALSVARRKGLLTNESQYLSLAGALYGKDVPLNAASVLEEGLRRNIITANAKNLRFLSACYSQAREYEKALTPLQQAAAKTEDGEIDALLGNTYFQLTRWQDAAAALETAIQKGQLKQLSTVWLLLGQSYLNQQQYERALYAFNQAGRDESRIKQAQQWIQYAEFEKSRQEERALLKSAPLKSGPSATPEPSS